jgi:hypothetical protein
LEKGQALAREDGVEVEFVKARASDLHSGPGGLRGPDGVLGDRRFDACLILGNTLPILGDQEELLGSLTLCRRAMTSGGVLIIQTPNYGDRISRRDSSTRFRTGTVDGKVCMLIKTLTFSERSAGGGTEVVLHLLCVTPECGTFALEDHAMVINALTVTDVGKLLDAAGFVRTRFFGSMDGREFKPDSPDLIVVTHSPEPCD